MKKRIIIGYIDYGVCNEALVNTLYSYFNENGSYDVMLLNFSNYISDKLRRISKFKYSNEFLYKLFNNKIASKTNLKMFINLVDSDDLRNTFKDFNPDIIISTHFYVNYVAGFYNNEKIVNSKLISIVSDYCCHSSWIINKNEVHAYLVHNDLVKREFVKSGVESEKVFITGIPVKLCCDVSKDVLIKRYNLIEDRPIYLFFGEYESDYDYFKDLSKRGFDFNIIYVCSKNKYLKDKCDNFIRDNIIKNVVVLSFVKDIYDIMNISDVIITKPDSYILNEVIGFKKPSILISGINSLERKNARYMVKRNYSVKVNSPYSLSRKVNSFLNYPFIVKSMANKLNKIQNKDSCRVCK